MLPVLTVLVVVSVCVVVVENPQINWDVELHKEDGIEIKQPKVEVWKYKTVSRTKTKTHRRKTKMQAPYTDADKNQM